MKMKKFLASVLAVLMTISSMSFIASAQEEGGDAPTTVTITFNRRNGAKNAAVSTATFNTGAAVSFPADPQYIYHTFKGWSTEIDGDVLTDDEMAALTATEAVTYYGVWEWSKADDGTPLDSISVAKGEKIANEGCADGGNWYDAIAGVVYKTNKPNKAGSTGSANMYSGIQYSIPGESLWVAGLVRTNMIDATGVAAGVYNTTNKDGTAKSYSLGGTPIKNADEWTVVLVGNDSIKDFGIGTHIDFDVTGNDPADAIGTDYYDVAGIAIFGSKAEAEAFDIYELMANTKATVYFDAQLTEDDDSDVYVEYPENLENDGNALVGWTLDPNAETVEYVDLTRVPVPEEDVTYYAVWNEERTYNFYKNDGTDAVETLVLGKGATINAPTFTIENKRFLGWAETPDGEVVDIQTIAETSADYYAIWLDTWLTEIVIAGNDYDAAAKNGSLYGIEGLETVTELNIVMPYGWPTSVVPTVVAKSNVGDAVYTAPETFDGEGSVVAGDVTYKVTFTVADRDSVSDITATKFSTVNNNGRGGYAIENNTDKGLKATKIVPIYSEESEYYEAGKYIPGKSPSVEGWDLFGAHFMESFDHYRALVYYDDGGDGIDKEGITPYIFVSGSHTRGSLKNKNIFASNNYKTNRWEYIYFKVPEDGYAYTRQTTFNLVDNTNASVFKNDVYYVAEIVAVVDADEKFLQYMPMELTSTNETSAKNDGTIAGLTSDMEIAIGDGEYALVDTFEGYDAEAGVLSGLAPEIYYVRYAGDDKYAASEAAEIEITPDSVEIYFEDGNEATEIIEQKYAYNVAITAPEAPEKEGYKFAGWALGDATEAYDFTNAVATADLDGAVFNALWERVTVLYVNGSATTDGNGLTAETPYQYITSAWNALAGVDGEIRITGVTKLMGTIKGHGGNITITADNEDAYLTWNGAVFSKGNGGSIKFENITLKYSGSNSWSFMNFKGLSYEFGEGFSNPKGTIDGVTYHTLKVRSGGEDGDRYTGADGKTHIAIPEKVVIRNGNFGALYLGGKGAHIVDDIYVEYYGGSAALHIGNDSGAGIGSLTNAKILLEAAPSGVSATNVSSMSGSYQLIANNGVTTVPALKTNEGTEIVPAGGKWLVYSAEGGRADFTDTVGTYKFTTDATYVVITDAEGNSTKYRVADGATGDANLYGEEASLELALPAGTYNVAYTNEGVSVKVAFVDPNENVEVELNAGNDYTATIPEAVISKAEQGASEGYKFSGEFASKDGKYTTVDGAITVTEYTAETIALYPVYVEDDSLAYYHAKAIYNDKNGTLDVTVSIANGKFTAGTVGGMFEKDVLAFADYTLADGISNNLGDAPEIVKDAMYDGENDKFVLVWDAMAGNVDATAGDVEIVTFHFDVLDAEAVTADNIRDVVFFWWPDNNYEGYYEDGYYQASPVLAEGEDEFAVNYVDVYTGEVEFELAPTDPATITVKVNMPDKAGATADNIAYLAYGKNGNLKFIALEEAGNEEAIEVVISDVFYVGETYDFVIVKNGYTGTDMKTITVESGMVLEATLDGGDIKESFTGVDENAVDIEDFGEGLVTLADFVRVVRAFDAAATDEYKAVVDINEDGVVNVTDLNIVKANYGKSYEECVITVTTADGE